MTSKEMIAQARAHWQEVNPKLYKKMEKRGDLEKELIASADLTRTEMDYNKMVGMSEQESWQAARELFILCNPAKNYTI